MRLSDLTKMRCVDENGDDLGRVKDVAVEEREGAWIATTLIVGRGGFAERLGFMHGVVEKPVVLARLMEWVERHARVVPWDKVRLREDRVVSVLGRRDELERPEAYR